MSCIGSLCITLHKYVCSLHKECLHSFQRSEMLVTVSVEVKWHQQQFLMEQQHHLLHLQTDKVGLQNEYIEMLLGGHTRRLQNGYM